MIKAARQKDSVVTEGNRCSCADMLRRRGGWGAYTHTAVTVNTVQILWEITNPLILGQLDYFRSHGYPEAIPHC